MIKNLNVFLSLFLVSVLLFSCQDQPNNNLKAKAILLWTADYAVDGCGFFIIIGDKKMKIENESIVPDSYKLHDSTWVNIEYESFQKTMAFNCGDLPYSVSYEVITLKSISQTTR